MIRIRTGASWKHDPDLRAALRRATGPVRAATALAVEDALAIEVDGIDITSGRAEGALFPSLEALLRAVARILGGAAHASVPFGEGALEVVFRRRETSALLSVVVLGPPSRVLARDVEVDLDALAAAALEASATLCRELAEIVPAAARSPHARRLRAAARQLQRTEPALADASSRSAPEPRARPPRLAAAGPPDPARVTCALELTEDDVLQGYEGGRPDLGALLATGTVTLLLPGAGATCALHGIPFLVLRDLSAAAEAIVLALRRGEPVFETSIAGHGRGDGTRLDLDLARGRLRVGTGPAWPCPPLELARAFLEAAAELGRRVRSHNPRQAENAYLADLEAAAAERLAHLDELAAGDVVPAAPAAAHAPAPPRLSQRPLGPGRLRRIAFTRVFEVDVGTPAGEGVRLAGGLALALGEAAIVGIDRASGRVSWRAEGATFAAALGNGVLAAVDGSLRAVAPRTGRVRWTRSGTGPPPAAAIALASGPWLVVDRGTVTALDPGSGRTLWRFEPPGATRVAAAAFGGIAAVGTDAGLLYGLDAAGRVAWRLPAPGPIALAPAPLGDAAGVLADAGAGAVLLCVDPATGRRRFETPVDFAPGRPPLAWRRRVVLAGAVGGDPIVRVLDPDGAPAWAVSPPLAGAPSPGASGPLLVVRDTAGAVAALASDGSVRWSRPAPNGHAPAGAAAPAIARGTVLVGGDGISALDARTGDLLGTAPGLAPARLAVDAALGIVAQHADGLVTGLRLATHLSVVSP